MSYGPTHPPFEIVQAETAHGGRRGCWLGALAVFAVITLIVLVAIAVPLQTFQALAPVDPDDDFAFARDSLRSKTRGIGKRDLKSLEAYFDQLLKSLRGETRKPFLEFVDLDRFFEQTKQYPEFGRQTLLGSASFRLMLGENLFTPHAFQRCDIVHAHRSVDRRDLTLMTYCWEGEFAVPMIWWLTSYQGEWRIYDWNALPFGERASQRIARRCSGSEFSDFYDRLARWDLPSTLDSDSPNYREAMEQLFIDVDAGRVPDNLRGALLLAAAYNATYLDRGRATLEALKRCRHPDQLPGFHYLEALVRDYQGNRESSLRALERYEAVLGTGPDIGRMKARLLANLGRHDEAHATWRGLLRFLPENEQVLRECLFSSPGRPPDELARVLTRLPTLESFLLSTAADSTDPAHARHIEWLAEFAREHLPDSCADCFLSGALARLKDDIPQAEYFLRRAVDLFQQPKTAPAGAATTVASPAGAPTAIARGSALPDEEDPLLRSPLEYLRAMLLDEDADVLSIYSIGDDREEAFQYLAMQYELGEIPAAGFHRVVQRHHELQPASPAGIIAWSRYLRYQSREEESIDLLTSSIDSGIHNQELLDEWVQRMVRSGRAVEAYRKYPRPILSPGKTPFEPIAVHCVGEPLRDQFAALIAAHRSSFPSDAMLPIYESIIAAHEQRWEEADAMLAAQLATTGDASQRSVLTQSRVQLRLRAERLAEIIPQVDPTGEYFGLVMRHAIELRQWQVAEQLLVWQRGAQQPVEQQVYWSAELAAKMGNDVECVRGLLLRPEQLLNSPLAYILRRRLLHSLLRLHRTDEAWNQAESWWNHDNDTIHCLMVAIARRDVENALRIAESLRNSGGSTAELYLADTIVEPLWSPEFTQFRQQFPPHVTYRYPDFRLIAIWRTPPSDPRAIALAVTQSIQGGDVASLDDQIPPQDKTISFGSDARAGLLTQMHGPLVVDGQEIRAGDGSMSGLSTTGAWCEITLLGPESDLYGKSRSRLMQGLFDTGCSALYLPQFRRLVPLTPPVLERLTRESEADWSHFPTVTVDLYPADESRNATVVSRRVRRQIGRQLVSAATGTRRVVVLNRLGSAEEQLELTNIQPPSGTQVLRGRLTANSRLDPRLRRGEFVEFTTDEILEMSAAPAESVHSGGT